MRQPLHEPTPKMPVSYPSLQLESELVVAIFRTVLIILTALSSQISGMTAGARLAIGVSVLAAGIYNLIAFAFALNRIHLRGQRWVMVAADMLMASVWIYYTWGIGILESASPLFPFYYLIIIVSAFWFSVGGAMLVASLCGGLFLVIVSLTNGADTVPLVDALFHQVIYLYLVALLAGYVIDTHKRERQQWTRSQVLLAQYQERFRTAQEMYELLIPARVPQIAGLDLGARWRPALQEGGGDFYDIIPLENGRVVITIADVSGKFTRSALKLPLFKAAFMATAQVWDDPGQMLSHVNRIVYPLLQPEMFISACILILDRARGELLYANAGQDAPVFVRARTHETEVLETGGLLLGIDDHAAYPTERRPLEPGDTLCLFTDGITEARSPNGDEFGIPNIEARVQAGVAIGLTADAIAENLFDAVTQHLHGERRHDDMTLVVVRMGDKEQQV